MIAPSTCTNNKCKNKGKFTDLAIKLGRYSYSLPIRVICNSCSYECVIFRNQKCADDWKKENIIKGKR